MRSIGSVKISRRARVHTCYQHKVCGVCYGASCSAPFNLDEDFGGPVVEEELTFSTPYGELENTIKIYRGGKDMEYVYRTPKIGITGFVSDNNSWELIDYKL